MGAVYRAMDTRFTRPCAVKEMLDEFRSESERVQAAEWFKREATLLLDLNHPCIPRVRDFFAENGRNYLVMDFIDGRTLADVIDREGNVIGVNGSRGIAEARVRSWAQQVCNVLSYLHRQTPPVIFRDLKPSNIMVTEREEIKLIDFGIARPFQSQTQSTIIMTPGYAPPEQLYGRAEPRSDIYALGATLHKILTRHDAANNQPGIFSFPAVRSLRPDISPAFDQVVMKCLNPDVEQRWSSAAEMERALMGLPPITVVPPVSSVFATAFTLAYHLLLNQGPQGHNHIHLITSLLLPFQAQHRHQRLSGKLARLHRRLRRLRLSWLPCLLVLKPHMRLPKLPMAMNPIILWFISFLGSFLLAACLLSLIALCRLTIVRYSLIPKMRKLIS